MGELSKIQWTDNTFNPWIGCTKVSPGCAHCYAEVSTRARVLRSQGLETWGKGANRSRTKTWNQPVLWNRFKVCAKCGYLNATTNDSCGRPDPNTGWCEGELRKQRVFCASLSDWLDDLKVREFPV
jgi:hypothetical protein